jgi:glycine betaine/proline transport system ATP-binding protein
MQELLLTLQKEHKRTIIFVSHDLDEAFRIGNRIAIMEGGRVVQIGTPDDILRNPADDYVRAFFKGVDVKRYLTAKDVALQDEVLVMEAPTDIGAGFESAIGRLRQMRRYSFVVDKEGRVLGTVSIDSMHRCLEEGKMSLEQALLDDIQPIPGDTRINELICHIVKNPYPLPIIDGERRYLGAVTQTILLRNMVQETANA